MAPQKQSAWVLEYFQGSHGILILAQALYRIRVGPNALTRPFKSLLKSLLRFFKRAFEEPFKSL